MPVTCNVSMTRKAGLLTRHVTSICYKVIDLLVPRFEATSN